MSPANTRCKLLIVDDEPANIHVLTNILSEEYDIRAANNGERALQAARTQAPDLILLDMIMPELDGLSVCKMLKDDEQTSDIPVIFVTSMSDTSNEELGLQAGAVDYITKPISPPIVKARVKIHIQNRLTVRFLEGLLSSETTSLEQAKNEAESLLLFV